MDINTAFPSKWLKASDLKGRTVRVKISHVQSEEVGGDQLPVIYFLGAQKGIVLNKTNSNSISDAYGFETDNWGGKEMEVFPSTTDYQGRIVECVRMRPVIMPSVASGEVIEQPQPLPAVEQPAPTDFGQQQPGPQTNTPFDQPTPPPNAAIPQHPLSGGASGLDDDIPFKPG